MGPLIQLDRWILERIYQPLFWMIAVRTRWTQHALARRSCYVLLAMPIAYDWYHHQFGTVVAELMLVLMAVLYTRRRERRERAGYAHQPPFLHYEVLLRLILVYLGLFTLFHVDGEFMDHLTTALLYLSAISAMYFDACEPPPREEVSPDPDT